MTERLWLVVWLVLFVASLHLVVRMIYRRWAIKTCRQMGHDWRHTQHGIRCRRCPVRYNEGDEL